MVVSRVLDRGMIHRQGVNGAPTPPLPFHSFSIPPFFLNFTLSLPFYSFSSRRHSSRTSITIAGILRVGDEIEEVNGNRLENESIASIQALLVCARLPSFSPSSFTSSFPYTSHPPIPFLPSRGIVKDRCPSSSFRPPDTNTNKPRHLHYLFFIHFLPFFSFHFPLFFLFILLPPSHSQRYVKALFSYDPSQDSFIPSTEAGLPFSVGDILKVGRIGGWKGAGGLVSE